MSKRSLIIMSFLFVFAFGGALSDSSLLSAKTESKSEQTNKQGPKKKKKNTSKKKSGKKNTKKKKSGKKGSSGKKKSNKKKSGKKYSKKKKSGKKKRTNKKSSRNTSRSYNNSSYSPPKTYDLSSPTDDNSSREYKRSSQPTETFKKEPKKEGDN